MMTDSPRRLLAAFTSAWRTLTVLRLPGRDAAQFCDALPFFPLIGLLLGGLAAGVAWLGLRAGGPVLAGLAGAGMLTLCTGALHVDGLADAADALYGERSPQRRLEIMKDPRIGAMGAVALIFAVLLKVFAIARLAGAGGWAWMVLPVIWSRVVMVGLAVTLPYARPSGTAQAFVAGARPAHLAAALALALALTGWYAPAVAIGCALASTAIALVLRHRFLRAVGGLTGDLLGFACETTEIVLLLGLALLAGRPG